MHGIIKIYCVFSTVSFKFATNVVYHLTSALSNTFGSILKKQPKLAAGVKAREKDLRVG